MSAGRGPVAGRELAGYRLLHTLGAGGASEVFLAQRLEDPAALVAFKILRPVIGMDAAAAAALEARFLREAEAARRLAHPNILPVLAYGHEDDLDYMVLPFIAGGTLTARINAFTRGMPLTLVSDYLAQIAAALDYAHEHGVIHRDVKPANILLAEDDRALLADFGIARLFEASGHSALATLTVEGQMLGTPAYMAPEQLDGPRVSSEADIYALGVTLYQMVTGALPFEADTPIALAMKRLQTEPPPPRRDRADLPAPAQAAILRALARRPNDRYPTAGALARAFDAGIRGQLAPEELDAPGSGASTVAATPLVAFAAAAGRAVDQSAQASQRDALDGAPSWRAQITPTQPDPHARRISRGGPALWMLMGIALTIVAIVTGALLSGLAPAALGLGGPGKGLFGLGLEVTATATRPATPVATATISPASAACRALPGYSAASAPAYGGASFADTPFPSGAVSLLSQTFVDGSYHFILLDACAPTTTAAGLRAFYSQAMPANGWSPSSTYPYAGNPDRACGDTFCWTKGSAPKRYVSLESVVAHGAQITYQLRFGVSS